MSAGLAGLLALALAQAPPVFRSDVELVYVDVTVTRKDAPVRDLVAEDFVVTDNGVRQRVTLVDRESTLTTAILALDLSASVDGAPLVGLRAAADAFLQRMAPRDEAALVTFSHRLELRQAPTTDRAAVSGALAEAEAYGSTSVIDALYLCLKGRWGGGRPVVVLFTDGVSEATGENDALFTTDRIADALAVTRAEPSARLLADGLAEHVRAFVGAVPQSDDIAILVVSYENGSPVAGEARTLSATV